VILELSDFRPPSLHGIIGLYDVNSPSTFHDISNNLESFSSIPIFVLGSNRAKIRVQIFFLGAVPEKSNISRFPHKLARELVIS
jgi:hypothetical protein